MSNPRAVVMSDVNDDPMLVVRDLDTGTAVPLSEWRDDLYAQPGLRSAVVQDPRPPASTSSPAPTAQEASSVPHQQPITATTTTSRRVLIKQSARRALGQGRTNSELSMDSNPPAAPSARADDTSSTANSRKRSNVQTPPSIPVRVSPHKKTRAEFRHLRRFQLLDAHSGPVRVLALSPSGLYLSSGGADAVVHIWRISSRGTDFHENSGSNGLLVSAPNHVETPQTTEPFLCDSAAPYRTYRAHSGDIIAMSWSKNDFLLTGGLDRQLMLWHPSEANCLRSFQHHDIITALTFHPLDEQICVSGTASGMLRLWHLKENKLLSEAATEEMITATTISPDGKTLLAGTDVGRCKFYTLFDEIQGEWQLIHTTQMDVRSSRGKNRKGGKVTGITFNPHDSNEVLISSNDSRMRRYRMEDKSIFYKYTGHVCLETQLRGSFSPCGKFVMTGSENRHVYIWNLEDAPPDHQKPDANHPIDDSNVGGRDRNSRHESFLPHEHELISDAVFAHTRYYPMRDAGDPRPGNSGASGLVLVTASEAGRIGIFACL
jgi:WD40 repeat protein